MNHLSILISVFAFLNAQNIVAQTISNIKYSNGNLRIRYHIRQNDTFCTENWLENGKFHSIRWHDSAHYFHLNQIIAQKTYGPKRVHSTWLPIVAYVEQVPYMNISEAQYDEFTTYYPDGHLENQTLFKNDSVFSHFRYAPNGQLHESVICQKQKNNIFNYLKTNENVTKKFIIDTAAKTIERFGYRNNRLVQHEFFNALSMEQTNLVKQELIDSLGKVDFIWERDTLTCYPDKDNGVCLYGFRNQKGDWVIPPKYESVELFNHAFYIANQAGKYGIINKYAEIVVPFIWDYLEELDRNRWAWISNESKPIRNPSHPFVFEDIDLKPNPAIELLCRQHQNYGVIDMYGNIMLQPIYQSVRQGYYGLYEVSVSDKSKWGIVDGAGHILVPPQYWKIAFTPYKDLFITATESGQGLVNDKGKTLLPMSYSKFHISENQKRYIWVSKSEKDQRYYLFHADKGWLVDTNAHSESNWYFLRFQKLVRKDASLEKQLGLFDRESSILLLPFEYQAIIKDESHIYNPKASYDSYSETYQMSHLYYCQQQGKWGVFDAVHRKWILPLKYDKIHPFRIKDRFYMVSVQGRWQVLDENAKPYFAETVDFIGIARYFNTFETDDDAPRIHNQGYAVIQNDTTICYTDASFPEPSLRECFFSKEVKIIAVGEEAELYAIDTLGKIILSPQFKPVFGLKGAVILRSDATKEQKMIDIQGNITSFLPKYDIVQMNKKYDWVLVHDTLTHQLGVYNWMQKEIFPPNALAITPPDRHAIIWVRHDSAWTLGEKPSGIDTNWQMYHKTGALLTNQRFDYPFKWANDLGIGRVRGKQGLWNSKGQNILPPHYDKIFYDEHERIFHLMRQTEEDKFEFGFANAKGQLIIDAVFKNMSFFSGNLAFVETEQGYGMIQKNGQYRIQPQVFALANAPFPILDTMERGAAATLPILASTEDDLFPQENQLLWQQHIFKAPYPNAKNPFSDTFTVKIPRFRAENLLLEKIVSRYFLSGRAIPIFKQDSIFAFNAPLFVLKEVSPRLTTLLKQSSLRQHENVIESVIGMDNYLSFTESEHTINGFSSNIYNFYNFKLQNNIWEEVYLDNFLLLNDANVVALNQIMFQKIRNLKNKEMDCGNPSEYMKRVENQFQILSGGIQFLMPTNTNNDLWEFVEILFTWEELKAFLVKS
jgi:WG containing repeat